MGLRVLLVLMVSLASCATDPCTVDPGSIACNKVGAAKVAFKFTYMRCMANWKAEEQALSPYHTIIRPCGEDYQCCLEAAHARRRSILK